LGGIDSSVDIEKHALPYISDDENSDTVAAVNNVSCTWLHSTVLLLACMHAAYLSICDSPTSLQRELLKNNNYMIYFYKKNT
jgi:hypothetical protein